VVVCREVRIDSSHNKTLSRSRRSRNNISTIKNTADKNYTRSRQPALTLTWKRRRQCQIGWRRPTVTQLTGHWTARWPRPLPRPRFCHPQTGSASRTTRGPARSDVKLVREWNTRNTCDLALHHNSTSSRKNSFTAFKKKTSLVVFQDGPAKMDENNLKSDMSLLQLHRKLILSVVFFLFSFIPTKPTRCQLLRLSLQAIRAWRPTNNSRGHQLAPSKLHPSCHALLLNTSSANFRYGAGRSNYERETRQSHDTSARKHMVRWSCASYFDRRKMQVVVEHHGAVSRILLFFRIFDCAREILHEVFPFLRPHTKYELDQWFSTGGGI